MYNTQKYTLHCANRKENSLRHVAMVANSLDDSRLIMPLEK